jgi:probable HAF family extracellular repeat protein
MPAIRLTLLAALALSSAARAQVLYTATELPPPPASQYAYGAGAVNNVGQSAGTGSTLNPFIPPRTAIRHTPGVGSQDLGAALSPPVSVASASDLNDGGRVVGSLFFPEGERAARYTDGVGWLNLGTLPGHTLSRATGINNAGQVTGQSSTGTASLPFRYTDGVGMQNLGLPPGTVGAFGAAINNRGQVAVNAAVSATIRQAFRYTDGVGYQDLGTLGGTDTNVNAINGAGQVVGFSRTAAGASRPFLYTDGVGMVDLGALPGGGGGTAGASIPSAKWSGPATQRPARFTPSCSVAAP